MASHRSFGRCTDGTGDPGAELRVVERECDICALALALRQIADAREQEWRHVLACDSLRLCILQGDRDVGLDLLGGNFVRAWDRIGDQRAARMAAICSGVSARAGMRRPELRE